MSLTNLLQSYCIFRANFLCNYNMANYPFDIQTCYVGLQLQEQSGTIYICLYLYTYSYSSRVG